MNRISEEQRVCAEKMIEEIMQEYDACGLAACIIDHTGKTQYELFRGFRSRETEEPVNGDTVFGLASVTKSFTALSVMKLKEEGILSLNDRVSSYIPEFTDSRNVTVEHLLTHSGGYYPQKRILIDETAKDLGLSESADHDFAYDEALAAEGCRRVAGRLSSLSETIGEPGRYFSYCNDGYGILSEIIRRYGGCGSFAEYLNKNILGPLGMQRSFCDFYRPAHDDNAAVLYEKKDGVMHGHRDYHDNAFVLNGGGAMKSTLNDLKKYMSLYLNEGCTYEGVRILSRKSIREMTRPRIPFGYHGSYGYGLYTEMIGNLSVTGHGGSLPGVSSNIAFSCDCDCAVIVLCNTSDVPVSAASRILFRMYAGMDLNEEPVSEQPLKEGLKEKLPGNYESEEGTSIEIVLNDENRLQVIQEGKTKEVKEAGLYACLVHNRFSDTVLIPLLNDRQEIFAVQYGSRIIVRI